jgi:hypothetical protein
VETGVAASELGSLAVAAGVHIPIRKSDRAMSASESDSEDIFKLNNQVSTKLILVLKKFTQ